MEELNLISEDNDFLIFEDIFHGKPARFFKNKHSGEIKISTNDVARCLGYESVNDMLSEDSSLDTINEWKRKYPDKPVFGSYGSGALFESIQNRIK